MHDRIGARQAGAWCFCALSVPAVLTCAKVGWNWALAAGLAAAGYFGISRALEEKAAERDLGALTLRAYGALAGKIILALGGIFTLLAAAKTAARAGAAFCDQTRPLAPGAVLLLAGLANRKGAARAARVCGVLALGLVGLYGVILWTAAGELERAWLLPWGSWRQGAAAFWPMLAAGCVRFVPRQEKKAPGGALLLLALGPAAVALVTAGCLSPALARTLEQPFYVLMQSLNVFGVMERFEPLGSAALFMGFFALVSLLLAGAQAQISKAVPRAGENEWTALWLSAGAYLLGLWIKAVPEEAFTLGAAIFWGALPILTQLIVAIKKD